MKRGNFREQSRLAREIYKKEGLHAWLKFLRDLATDKGRKRERYQAEKLVHRVPKHEGFMNYVGLKIVKKMESAGYPSFIHCCYRSPTDQETMVTRRVSKAHAWQSPHQYYEAVDIIHKTMGWNVSDDYWKVLAICVRSVADELNIDLEHGHYWRFTDSAHIEYKHWRSQKNRYLDADGIQRPMTVAERLQRFKEVLPQVPFSSKEKHLLNSETE